MKGSNQILFTSFSLQLSVAYPKKILIFKILFYSPEHQIRAARWLVKWPIDSESVSVSVCTEKGSSFLYKEVRERERTSSLTHSPCSSNAWQGKWNPPERSVLKHHHTAQPWDSGCLHLYACLGHKNHDINTVSIQCVIENMFSILGVTRQPYRCTVPQQWCL